MDDSVNMQAKTMLETVLEAALKAARPEIQRAVKDAVDATLNAGSMAGIVSVMTVDRVFEEYHQNRLPYQAAEALNTWVVEEMKKYIEENKPALQALIKQMVADTWEKEKAEFGKRIQRMAKDSLDKLVDKFSDTARRY